MTYDTNDLDYHSDLEWSKLSDIEPGECYTLATDSPMTFLMLGKFTGRNGRPEYDVTTLVGPSGGRATTRTFFRGGVEVLVVPPEVVGERIAHAAVAFTNRNFNGSERIELSVDCWPLSLVSDTDDAEVAA
ncbi:hypothetical protein [Brevibacterium aurantiacum]|uniref:hypothetical protein n=1 Tax=Brevibacterium aurantiacum TaxID=273384 RepID=UPI001867226D|nr:hypothetical protein [Brevibacterium aurantiacum]